MAIAESRGTILAGKLHASFATSLSERESNYFTHLLGSDTTGTAITSTLFYLMTNPSAMKKLRTEIDIHYNDIGDMHNAECLAKLPYLNAVL